MRSYNRTYTITEYGGFTRGPSQNGFQGLPEKTFDALETFLLANNWKSETETIELLSLSVRKGMGKVITARNYVGLIAMTDGTVIEILPKIVGSDISDGEAKRIFLDMLKTLKDVTFKSFNVSNLRVDRLSLFEIFIKMFLDEVTVLTKQGLKASYFNVEENERFYKGKLLASQNIKHNLINRERFFVRYDHFNINRPENRLIKSTLRFLLTVTNDNNNRRNVMRLLSFFDGVDFSSNIDDDFTKCFVDRSMIHYDKAISWSLVFLKGNSFSAYSGSKVALALLFPMEKIFESFIADKVRKFIRNGGNIRTQDTRYSLFDKPSRAFMLRPDIVIENEGKTIVIDTKWKLLSENVRNNGILQSDMYQMYAYCKKYNAEKIVLLYPNSDLVSKNFISYESHDNVNVLISCIDLRNVEESIIKILSEILK